MITAQFKSLKENQIALRKTTAKQRVEKLKKLKKVILEHQNELQKAVYLDFKKPSAEVDLTEIFPVFCELEYTIKNLKNWVKPHPIRTPRALPSTKSELRYEPKGVVLIIGPWNYPIQLIFNPIISAVAAGNSIFVKPSEVASHTSVTIKKVLEKVFSPSELVVVQGGPETTQELLKLPFDHVFFTGSTHVGRVILEATSKNLTPTTLELGGKSPVIISECSNLKDAAEKIIWGKMVNCGQSCIAPDYLLVHELVHDELVIELKKVLEKTFGASEKELASNKDIARIISDRHFSRIKGLYDDAIIKGATPVFGGYFNEEERFISPTLLTNVALDSTIFADEIFGPILPIVKFKDWDHDAQAVLELNPKPLALYVFSDNEEFIEKVLNSTRAGGTTVNNVLLQIANPHLPFGGIGPSGLGSYHGFYGFRTFSHERGFVFQGRVNPFKAFYPPYNFRVKSLIKFALRYLIG